MLSIDKISIMNLTKIAMIMQKTMSEETMSNPSRRKVTKKMEEREMANSTRASSHMVRYCS